MAKIWETISSKIVLETKWFKIKHDRYILPNKKEGDYYFVASNGSSMVIPVQDDGKIVMIKQYRYLNKKISLEFPAGGIKANNSALNTAIEELREESGYISERIEKIGSFNPFNGATDEICNVYIARELKRVEKDEDDTEKIEVFEYTVDHVNKLIEDQIIWDGQTIVAWYLAKQHLK